MLPFCKQSEKVQEVIWKEKFWTTKGLSYTGNEELRPVNIVIEVFANNANLTFLYKIGVKGVSKVKSRKLPPVGIELTKSLKVLHTLCTVITRHVLGDI